MLYESAHLRVTADDGVATVWLAFPGLPANALDAGRVRDLGRALDAALGNPHLDAVVIRSGLPAGFCGGYTPGCLAGLTSDDDAAGFARAGQKVFARLAAADVVTMAYIEGPCVGPGLELALACDYRLAVAGPGSAFGFPDAATGVPPCWGGPTRLDRLRVKDGRRLRHGGPLSLRTAKEALREGLIDHAFSQRRGKIELRTWLDRVQADPTKPRNITPGVALETGFADERAEFRHAIRAVKSEEREVLPLCRRRPTPSFPLPETVGVIAVDHVLVELAVEAALRGSRAVVVGATDRLADLGRSVTRYFGEVAGRGRATPLETEQARARLTLTDDASAAANAGLVVVDSRTGRAEGLILRKATITAVLNGPADSTRQRVVGLSLPARFLAYITPGPATDSDTMATLGGWLPTLGFRTVVRPAPAGETTHRVAA